MKKQPIYWLLLATSVFAALLVGFLLGRNLNRSSVQISQLPQATYAEESTAEQTELQATSDSTPQKININTANSEELQMLPGIGPVLAERIIRYRTVNGPFDSVDDITRVSGIGEKKLDAIRDMITVVG